MRSTFTLPLTSHSGTLRFQFQNTFTPGSNLIDPAHPYGSVLFTTSDLGNGMFLSAGTSSGNHSMAGTPASPQGNGDGPKHSGPSVALKLSF
jgi:hypothetical protein